MDEQKVTLNRSLGLWSALSLVIGTIIGSGVFVQQAAVLDKTGSVSGALWAWLAGGVMTLTAGLTIAEIASQMPKTGGLYYYMDKMYGRIWGFLSGWMQIIVYGPAMIAALSAYLGILLVDFFGMDPVMKIPIAVGTVVLVAMLNFFSNRIGASFAIITTLCKLVPIAGIIIFGLFFGRQDALTASVSTIHASAGNFGVAILGTLFAYDGWILVANLGGEIKNPEKRLPQAIVFGILSVSIIYLLVSFAVFKSVSAEQVHRLGIGAIPYLANKSFGLIGGRILSIGIIISIVGCMNGKVMTFPRIMYAMARNKELPFSKQLGYLNQKTRTPVISIIVVVAIAIIMILFFNADRLSELCIFTVYCFYVMAFVGSFKLRRNGQKRPFSAPLFPLTPLIAIGSSLFVLGSEVMNDTEGVVVSLLIVACGVPVYMYQKRKPD
ncbi:APC family permease [Pediococcus claussenii]|uniref:Serine/threonine exchanger SteT n=1 Tax=Pediococcus claussenii (strain ATCC BAA-344 / DSM 14800 / JCM 18046 / KCTC 3811 / LMG 21948 / P06) TaxID=701521 RepID=G8PBR9_PEDCP|nr:amino acid permease [Pediococcus claussenii]AEV95977.1 serine/threonine exchanger SteT [Pediococcus claussenii ATCC BAA-344]ANZ69464.1 serine/threonine protein kinase [Pediococcus claussenii]ANZ71284.1 serine/threonine protein kinase [Pediococcus claussenii]KRN20583.1 steT protein [Pediococcus claussenii]